MSEFTANICINAEPVAVWDALADLGSIAMWNPGLTGSKATNELEGVGGTRHCVISETQSLDEEVVHFDPLQSITFRITRSPMPFKSADIRFKVMADAAGTTVTVSPLYALKYGPIGILLDRLPVRRMYRRGMRGLLAGLKGHIEANAIVPSPRPRLPRVLLAELG
jgi:hypothetical protein